MTTDLATQATITIDAPAERVWEALTTPDLIKRWFFEVETETDWAEGARSCTRASIRTTL